MLIFYLLIALIQGIIADSQDFFSCSSKDNISACINGSYCPPGFRFITEKLLLNYGIMLHEKSSCLNGVVVPCAPGTFKFSADNIECNVCPEGWYCPGTGTSDPYTSKALEGNWLRPCPTGPLNYCPAGSSRPLPVAQGFYAINSHFADGGGYGAQIGTTSSP